MSNVEFNIKWDAIGEREYEVGASRCVLYPMVNGEYQDGVAWNGLTGVDENPEGADIQDTWADNIKYVTFQTPESHKGVIKAYMFPDEFYPSLGMISPEGMPGLIYGGQKRTGFGFCYRTELGTDTDEEAGYKLHLVYNCKTSALSRSHATKTDNIEPEEMNFDYSSTPVPVTGIDGVEYTSTVEVKSTDFAEAKMTALETVLYGTPANGGTAAVPARLPSPGEVKTLLA